jgi:hypothetical protein
MVAVLAGGFYSLICNSLTEKTVGGFVDRPPRVARHHANLQPLVSDESFKQLSDRLCKAFISEDQRRPTLPRFAGDYQS